MKRSKHQAVYKYLPGVWTGYRDKDEDKLDDNSVTIKIEQWNYREVSNVFTDMIEAKIIRILNIFSKSGDIGFFKLYNNEKNFVYVEPAMIKDIPDIRGSISPLVFYCSTCGKLESYSDQKFFNKSKWICSKCNKKDMKQLQLIYACQCGEAYPVKKPYKKNKNEVIDYIYKPSGGRNNYKFICKNNRALIEQMVFKCQCGKVLYPSNASDGRNYIPFNVKTVNLIDNRNGVLYKRGNDAYKIILANYLSIIDDNKYSDILNDIDDFFENSNENEIKKSNEFIKKVEEYIEILELDKEEAETKAFKALCSKNDKKNVATQNFIKPHLPIIDSQQLEEVSAQILEFNTIKKAKKTITIEEAIKRQIDLEILEDENIIKELNERFGIKNTQVSLDIEIITSTFAYTRKYKNPKEVPNGLLKLKSYQEERNNKKLVYCSNLLTEGILIEFDKRKILNWLLTNKYIEEYNLPDLDNDTSINKWFIENIKVDRISDFDNIDKNETGMNITYYVYNLIHSMSHAFIKSAGIISGLDKNSIAEIIFPNLTSIFIYANTTQGIPLGVLSGMFEENYKLFISQAKDIMLNCIFDPICMDRDNGACSACSYLSEVSCTHFNKDLTRKFLVGEEKKESSIKGFWEFI